MLPTGLFFASSSAAPLRTVLPRQAPASRAWLVCAPFWVRGTASSLGFSWFAPSQGGAERNDRGGPKKGGAGKGGYGRAQARDEDSDESGGSDGSYSESEEEREEKKRKRKKAEPANKQKKEKTRATKQVISSDSDS